MSSKQIGMIAENNSDIEVLKILAGKITNRSFSIDSFVGKGCGPIKRKMQGWCNVFIKKGCQSVVVVHDRDRNNEKKLRKELEEILDNVIIKTRAVVIPVEEIEAWLLSDPSALKKAMRLTKLPKKIHNPETITSPKEYLQKLVRSHSKNKIRVYVNTSDNSQIAKATNINQIQNCCPSFEKFRVFVTEAISK